MCYVQHFRHFGYRVEYPLHFLPVYFERLAYANSSPFQAIPFLQLAYGYVVALCYASQCVAGFYFIIGYVATCVTAVKVGFLRQVDFCTSVVYQFVGLLGQNFRFVVNKCQRVIVWQADSVVFAVTGYHVAAILRIQCSQVS